MTTLDASNIVNVLQTLDNELGQYGNSAQIVIVGGAAIALVHGNRSTRDIDLISDSFTPQLAQAAAATAEQHGLPDDWLNAGAKGFTPALEPNPRQVFQGTNLTAYVPDDRYLLAMKLYAARETDTGDAALLANSIGITDHTQLLDLVESAYRSRPIETRTQYFAIEVAGRAFALSNDSGPEPPSL